MLASLLALLASLCWGSSDFLAGLESRRTSPWAVALVGQWVAGLGSLAVLAILRRPAPGAATLVVLVAGGLGSAIGVFASYRALTLTKMSVVAPIFAGAAAVPVLWGLATGESPDRLQLLGIVATLAGIALISRRGPEAAESPSLPVDRRGVLLAVVAAAGLGTMLVALHAGAAADSYWSVAVVRGSAALCVAVWLALTRPALRLRRSSVAPLVAVGVLILAANLLFTVASTAADLSIVAVLGWLGPAVTVLWAGLVLRERLRTPQWLAAALVLAGVVCLAAA